MATALRIRGFDKSFLAYLFAPYRATRALVFCTLRLGIALSQLCSDNRGRGITPTIHLVSLGAKRLCVIVLGRFVRPVFQPWSLK